MIGLLSGGYVDPQRGKVVFFSADEPVLTDFQNSCADILNINATKNEAGILGNGRTYYAVGFYNVLLARSLGDLRRTEWPQTVNNLHPWLKSDPDYLWGFLEGYFEMRG